MVKRYQPEAYHVEFYKIEPGHKVGLVAVTCGALAEARTRIEVTYQYTALSEQGEAFVKDFDEATYAAFIGEWETLLNDHFARA